MDKQEQLKIEHDTMIEEYRSLKTEIVSKYKRCCSLYLEK